MGALRRLVRDESGASAVEYIVAVILCCMVVLGINKIFGDTLRAKFQAGQNEIAEMDAPEEVGSGADSKSLGARAAAGGSIDKKRGSGGAKGQGASGAASASGSGSGGGGEGEGGGGVKGVKDRGDQTGSAKKPGGYIEELQAEKRAGFNPLLLLIFLGLGGLLMFIMYKGNKG